MGSRQTSFQSCMTATASYQKTTCMLANTAHGQSFAHGRQQLFPCIESVTIPREVYYEPEVTSQVIWVHTCVTELACVKVSSVTTSSFSSNKSSMEKRSEMAIRPIFQSINGERSFKQSYNRNAMPFIIMHSRHFQAMSTSTNPIIKGWRRYDGSALLFELFCAPFLFKKKLTFAGGRTQRNDTVI